MRHNFEFYCADLKLNHNGRATFRSRCNSFHPGIAVISNKYFKTFIVYILTDEKLLFSIKTITANLNISIKCQIVYTYVSEEMKHLRTSTSTRLENKYSRYLNFFMVVMIIIIFIQKNTLHLRKK